MGERDILQELEFSNEWLELNIITPDLLDEFQREFDTGEDRNPEHYRWKAFDRFLKLNPALPPETLVSVYRLGELDPDCSMGGAMMRELLNRQDCPIELIEESLSSDRPFLVKAAQWAISRRLRTRNYPSKLG